MKENCEMTQVEYFENCSIVELSPEALVADVLYLVEVQGAQVVPAHRVELSGAQCVSCRIQVLGDDGLSLKNTEPCTRDNRQARPQTHTHLDLLCSPGSGPTARRLSSLEQRTCPPG